MIPRSVRYGPLIAVAAVVALSSSTLAATFTSAKIIRTAEAGVPLAVADMGASGDDIVVGWQEELSTGPATFMRWTPSGGSGFAGEVRLDAFQNREIAVDTCGGWAYAISEIHDPATPAGEWDTVLDGRDMSTGVSDGQDLSLDSVSRMPDIACVGSRRLATAWFQATAGAAPHVKVYIRPRVFAPFGADPPEYSYDLGAGSIVHGLSVAATNNTIYVAWMNGVHVRFARFSVGSGWAAPVTRHATVTLFDLQYGSTPKLGTAGSRVVLAYLNRADVRARTSNDGGVSFGAEKILWDEPFAGEIGAQPTSVDVVKSRVIVEAVEIMVNPSNLVTTGRGRAIQSTNGGMTWGVLSGTRHVDARQVGALAVIGGVSSLAEAWDQSYSAPSVQHVRFHRQT